MSNVVTLGQRKRREFLTKRVQDVSAYVAWGLRPRPIHRGRRSDRWAVVDGGTRRTGWPGGKNAHESPFTSILQ